MVFYFCFTVVQKMVFVMLYGYYFYTKQPQVSVYKSLKTKWFVP